MLRTVADACHTLLKAALDTVIPKRPPMLRSRIWHRVSARARLSLVQFYPRGSFNTM